MPNSHPELAARPLTRNEKELLAKHGVIQSLNAFGGYLSEYEEYPLESPGIAAASCAAVDDPELERMGINLSIVAPFKPIPVELAESSPLTAWAITRSKNSTRQEEVFRHNRVSRAKASNPRFVHEASSVAFPRYVEHRKAVKQNTHQGEALTLAKPQAYDRMKVFHDRHYSADIRTNERGVQTIWTQLPCFEGHDNQIKNGKPYSSAITYFRFDVYKGTAYDGDASNELLFSALVRGVIVEKSPLFVEAIDEDDQDWREWRINDNITFERLSEVFPRSLLGNSRPVNPFVENPRGPSPMRPSDRIYQVPSPATSLPRARVKKEPVHPAEESHHHFRTRAGSSRKTEHALSHRRRRMYGFLG